MTHYARRIREHWERYAPSRMKTLVSSEEAESFFSRLGTEVQQEVSTLSEEIERVMLAEMPETRENYLTEVALLTTARRFAEEIAMTHQLAWLPDPSLNLAEARQEWEDTRPMDDGLMMLVDRIQDSPYPIYSTEELEEIAREWAIPMWFLEGLIAAESPYRYLSEHQGIMEEAANMRFLREVQ